MVQDLRFALRLHARNLRAVSVVVFGLALAVGLSTALFAAVRLLTDSTIDVPNQEQLRWVRVKPADVSTWTPGLTARDLRAMESRVGVTSIAGSLAVSAQLEHGTHLLQSAQPVRFVSAGFFDVTGGSAAIGRLLSLDDHDEVVATPVVMSHGLWQREFDGRSDVIGRVVHLNARPFTVVGVASAGFTGPELRAPAFWAPLGAFDASWRDGARLQDQGASVSVLTRFGPSTSAASRLAELAPLGKQPISLDPIGKTDGFREATDVSVAAVGLVSMVLLLGCANVATLLAASNADRHAELATRVALGASRQRIWRQLMVEGLALSVAGGALGLVVALWVGRLIVTLVEFPSSVELVIDGPFLGFGFAAALASGVVASFGPAWRAAHGATPRHSGVWIVASQAALCLVVVGLTGLLVRGAFQAAHAELGYDSDPILTTAYLSRPNHSEADVRRRIALAGNLSQHVGGITQVALAQGAMFGSSYRQMRLSAGGRVIPTYIKRTSPEFAATIGLPIRRGRYLNAADMSAAPSAIVISAALARAGWGDADPIGADAERLHASFRGMTIVGVAADVVPHQLEDIGRATAVYLPLRPEDYRSVSLVIRTQSAGAPGTAAVREALRQLLPEDTPGVRSLSTAIEESRRRALIPARIALLAGLSVLALAAIGLGGVTATLVRHRRRDFAIHLALGASPATVRSLVFRHGLRPVLAGLVVGLGLVLPLAHWMRMLLYGISPLDPIGLMSGAIVLMISVFAAMLGPARHAGRISPAEALKE